MPSVHSWRILNIELKYGLPQDSVISPLGFVFYTHIVGHILRQHHLNYHTYANDKQRSSTRFFKISAYAPK